MKPIYLNEAIELLDVTKQTVYNYISKGFLKKYKNKLTGKIYFLDKDIDKLKSILNGEALPFTDEEE